MNRGRALLYAVLVLAVPLPALALERGEATGSLDVQASLGGCGVGDATISCRIDVSFSPIPDAEYYTASVTAPDGSVVELGTVAAGSTSAAVPFTGNGSYTVTVSAWGYDERGRPDVVDSARAGVARGAEKPSTEEVEATEPEEAPPAPEEPPPVPEEPPPPEEPPAPPEVDVPEVPEEPECPEPRATPEPDPAAEPAPTPELECEPPGEPQPPPVP